jgi:hypothetical protein
MVMTVNAAKGTIRAIALIGFYRGEKLVQPGEILELSRQDFAEHKSYYQVDYAPPEAPAKPAEVPKK